MNKVLMPLVLGGFILTASSYAQTPPPADASAGNATVPAASTPETPTPAPAAVTTPKVVHHHDPLHKAMHDLRLAKENLAKVTTADTDGHRAKAILDIENALTELRASLQ